MTVSGCRAYVHPTAAGGGQGIHWGISPSRLSSPHPDEGCNPRRSAKSKQRKQEQGGNREKEAHERLHTAMKCLSVHPRGGGREGIRSTSAGSNLNSESGPVVATLWFRRPGKNVSPKYCFDKYAISLWNSNLQLFNWHGHLCSNNTCHRLWVNLNYISDLGRGGCQWEVYEQYALALMLL